MERYWDSVRMATEFISERINTDPEIGLMTGTGLGESIGSLESEVVINFSDIPHFPVSTVVSHAGRLVAGLLHGRPVVVLQGRFHLYEGYSPLEVTFPVRVLQTLGVRTLIVTNAAGGLNPSFDAGDFMLICDHINLTGENPLIGKNEDAWGLRFPDMTRAYSPRLLDIAISAAEKRGIRLLKGVYIGLKGPSLETPAETRFIRQIGGDAVGLSTIMEVIAAVHAGMEVLGISTITNVNNPDNPEPATVEEIIAVAEAAAPRLAALFSDVVKES